MSYTLTLTRDERRAIDWIGNRYWHGSEFRKLLESCVDDDHNKWSEEADMTFHIQESIAWEISNHILDEDGDQLACFSLDFCKKLYEFCGKIV